MSLASEWLADSPLFFLEHAETSGTTIADSSPNSRDFTSSGSPTLNIGGAFTGGVAFDGVNDVLTSIASGTFVDTSSTAPLSYDAILTVDGTGGSTQMIVAQDGYTVGWYVAYLSSQGIYVQIYGRGAWGTGPSVNSILTDGNPHYVAISYDGTAASTSCTFTIDGTDYAASFYADAATVGGSRGTTTLPTIGRRRNTPSPSWFKGTIWREALYQSALSSARRAAHYAAAFGAPATTGAIAGTLPTLTGALAGTVTDRGTIAGALPALSGSLTASTPRTGTMAGTLPALTGSLTASAGTTTAALAGTLPALTGSLAGTVTATGVIAGTLPPLTGSLEGVNVGTGAVGDLAGTLPALTGDLAGVNDTEATVTVGDEVIVEAGVYIGLTAAPDPSDVSPIVRESYQMPALTAATPAYQAYLDYPVVREVVGWLHLWIGHRDVTYFRGVPTILREWYKEQPFGDKTCSWEMPQLEAWEKPGEGELDFLRPDAPVVIGIVDAEGNIRREWAGFYDSRTKGQGATARSDFEAKGVFWAALHKIHEPVPYQAPIDIGILIPRLLNAIPGRPWNAIPEKVTGRKTRERGARGEYVWTVVQRILAVDGWEADGRQWTIVRVGDDDFDLALKSPMSHIDATVAYGSPLVDVELTIDQSSRVDVAFARGIAENGGGWANVFYPATEILNGLPYPNADAGVFLTPGTTDADTDSGTGVTDWQQRAFDLGFTTLQPSGVLSPAWVNVVHDVQVALKLTVDVVPTIGPQTWEATMSQIDEDIDLTPRRLPMAYKPEAWATIDGAKGQVIGPNPDYDETIVPREVDVDLGPNVSKARGRELMKTYLAVHGEPSATGLVEFIACPNEMDRTRLDIGHNLAVPGFDGETPVVQLASKRVQMDGDGDGRQYVAMFTVDERARDALTIDQILERDRQALPDPARRPGNPNKQSRNVRDQAFEWDDESPCGVLPKTAINGTGYGGLWTRKVIPFSTVGQLSGIDLHCTVPFGFALFASLRVTPNLMRSLVGNIFASGDPWRPHMQTLVDDYGLLGCWGSQGDACGYGFGMESDGYAFNGRFREGATLEYVTETPPYASVLLFARGDSGFVWGNFLAARQS